MTEARRDTVLASEVQALLRPVERKFFWDGQSIFGANIADRVVADTPRLVIDDLVLSQQEADSTIIDSSRQQKAAYLRLTIAHDVDAVAEEVVRVMHEAVDGLDGPVGKTVFLPDIDESARLVNRGLDVSFRAYLNPLRLASCLRAADGSLNSVYALGLTNDLRHNIEVCVRSYIANARIDLACAMRNVHQLSPSVDNLSVR